MLRCSTDDGELEIDPATLPFVEEEDGVLRTHYGIRCKICKAPKGVLTEVKGGEQ